MAGRLDEYEALRIKKEVSVRYIGSNDQRDDLEKNKRERDFFDYRVLSGLFTGLVNTNICPHAVCFNIFGAPVTAFVMENETIADSYRQFFETLWNISLR